jgi:hypothetical protein
MQILPGSRKPPKVLFLVLIPEPFRQASYPSFSILIQVRSAVYLELLSSVWNVHGPDAVRHIRIQLA